MCSWEVRVGTRGLEDTDGRKQSASTESFSGKGCSAGLGKQSDKANRKLSLPLSLFNWELYLLEVLCFVLVWCFYLFENVFK